MEDSITFDRLLVQLSHHFCDPVEDRVQTFAIGFRMDNLCHTECTPVAGLGIELVGICKRLVVVESLGTVRARGWDKAYGL